MAVSMDQKQLESLGRRLYSQFEKYEKSRYSLEQQWLKNARQYRGVYDPDVKLRPNGSTAYPKFTRKWVNGTVSRLMQMLFPQTEYNWDIQPSPIPDLSKEDLQALLDELQSTLEAQAQQTGQPPGDITDEQIEEQIKLLAAQKCDRMRLKMRDQLSEMDYSALAKKVVFSGVLYGTGLLSGPFIKKEVHRTWKRDAQTGRYIALEKERLAPKLDHESVWDWYPDLTAKTRKSQDGYYLRRVMSREQVRKLAERPDFMASRVIGWLRAHPSGNFRERYWESETRSDGDRKYASELSQTKYEVLEWWGFVSGHELLASGVEIGEDSLGNQFEANVWMIGDTVIKSIVNPMEKQRRPLHEFVFEEDDLSLAGVGLPQVARDSQLTICEAARMMLDNASVVCTPSKLIKMGLLMPGHPLNTSPYMDWYQDVDAADNTQDAVKNLSFDSHIPEIQGIIELFKGIGEEEVSLPPISLGDTSQGGSEGARTQGNLSMLMGAASLPIRDTVRNFDLFSTSVMGSLYDWNMEFDEDMRAKGDYSIIARGSTSLMAKEVRAQHFNLLTQSVQPEEREHINWRKNITERMKTLDIMPEEVLLPEKAVQENRQRREELQKKAADAQTQLLMAQIQETVANAIKSQALAKKADAQADADTNKGVIETLRAIADQAGEDDERMRQSANDLISHLEKERDQDQKDRELDIREEEVKVKRIAANKPKPKASK